MLMRSDGLLGMVSGMTKDLYARQFHHLMSQFGQAQYTYPRGVTKWLHPQGWKQELVKIIRTRGLTGFLCGYTMSPFTLAKSQWAVYLGRSKVMD